VKHALPRKPSAAIYARVSTCDQTVAPQLDALRSYCERRGLDAVEFVDEGISGAKDRRPALDSMLAAVRRREVDLVAVVKLDRLARSVRHLTTLAAEFEALGVDLVVLDQGVDTSTPAGRLLFHVLASIAEFERSLIVERTRAGLAAARRRGTH
jgi:DNA invertase Pin-like site-specific DNA recombinase